MKLSKIKIGITGSNGFIGSHLIKRLSENKNLTLFPFDKTKYSLSSIDSLKDFVKDKDVIVHLAGLTKTDNISDFYLTNTMGTLNLLEAISRYAKKSIHFIFPSSFAVYKEIQKKELLTEEKTPALPRNHYGMSKLLAEEIIKYYNRKKKIKTGILRLANVYGPGGKLFVEKISDGKEVLINGTGRQVRDFIYIDDVIEAFIKTISNQKDNFMLVNICSGEETTIIDLIKKVEELLGKKAMIKYNKKDSQKGYWIGNGQLALEKIGFQPKIGLVTGIKLTYEKTKDFDRRSGHRRNTTTF